MRKNGLSQGFTGCVDVCLVLILLACMFYGIAGAYWGVLRNMAGEVAGSGLSGFGLSVYRNARTAIDGLKSGSGPYRNFIVLMKILGVTVCGTGLYIALIDAATRLEGITLETMAQIMMRTVVTMILIIMSTTICDHIDDIGDSVIDSVGVFKQIEEQEAAAAANAQVSQAPTAIQEEQADGTTIERQVGKEFAVGSERRQYMLQPDGTIDLYQIYPAYVKLKDNVTGTAAVLSYEDRLLKEMGVEDTFWGNMQGVPTIMFPWIISWVLKLAFAVQIYGILLEIKIRAVFIPIAVGWTSIDGVSGTGFRYLKHYAAQYLALACMFLLLYMANELNTVLAQTFLTVNGSAGASVWGSLVVNITFVTLMFRTQAFVTEAMG